MRTVLLLVLSFACLSTFAQDPAVANFSRDSLLIIPKDPARGFHHDYILFIPRGTKMNEKTYLLVEPNNTGKITDSMEVHRKYAIDLASVSSVGNNVSTELKIPLLVPIFPRPSSKPLVYTHALDRDVMLEESPELKRLDLQLINMIGDAQARLEGMHIPVYPKVFMNGFSASATFTNRFSFIHPGKIQALAMGGFNGELMLPLDAINGIQLDYPLGINDFQGLFDKTFDIAAYKAIPQYIYMGKLDDNDAVQFDDAYNAEERSIINENLAPTVQERYVKCQELFRENGIRPVFISVEKVGHWTTGEMNLEVIKFFLRQIRAN